MAIKVVARPVGSDVAGFALEQRAAQLETHRDVLGLARNKFWGLAEPVDKSPVVDAENQLRFDVDDFGFFSLSRSGGAVAVVASGEIVGPLLAVFRVVRRLQIDHSLHRRSHRGCVGRQLVVEKNRHSGRPVLKSISNWSMLYHTDKRGELIYTKAIDGSIETKVPLVDSTRCCSSWRQWPKPCDRRRSGSTPDSCQRKPRQSECQTQSGRQACRPFAGRRPAQKRSACESARIQSTIFSGNSLKDGSRACRSGLFRHSV